MTNKFELIYCCPSSGKSMAAQISFCLLTFFWGGAASQIPPNPSNLVSPRRPESRAPTSLKGVPYKTHVLPNLLAYVAEYIYICVYVYVYTHIFIVLLICLDMCYCKY